MKMRGLRPSFFVSQKTMRGGGKLRGGDGASVQLCDIEICGFMTAILLTKMKSQTIINFISKLLNWGDKTIHRYENGSIQGKAHNSLLLFLRDPGNMRLYLTENEVVLEEKQRRKLLDTIDHLEQENGGRIAAARRVGRMEAQISGLKNL